MSKEIDNSDWIYDLETYLDLFSACFVHVRTGTRFIFEVSPRLNQSAQFVTFIEWAITNQYRFFGYNNLMFDWPVIDHLLKIYRVMGTFDASDAHEKANAIIGSNDRWAHNVKPWEILIPQGDLLKINHFDNIARRTSLKKLEINMHSHRVIDLPYPPDQPTTNEQKDEIIAYMCHDVNETFRFYLHSLPKINFRDDLAKEQPNLGDVLNFSDGRIGEQIIISELEAAGTPCFTRVTGRKEPIQTIRSSINLGSVISEKVVLYHPEFKRIQYFLDQQTIRPDQTKGFFGMFETYVGCSDGVIDTDKPWPADQKKAFKTNGNVIIEGVSAVIDGFQYDFGTGGIHGSVHRQTIHEDDGWEIWDWDVASYYPNLAITHGWFPEHLSSVFTKIYEGVYQRRKTFAKGTPENAALKLALNVPYGNSNSPYSPFFDSQYTMSITINGQLLLCMLAEWLTHIRKDNGSLVNIADCVQLLQINTDGLTLKIRKSHIEWMKTVCEEWESHTGLELESVQYRSMFIRDVNSYMAVKKDGGVKRIGNYRIETPLDNPNTRELQWHQDHSALVVRKAVNAYFLDGTPIAEFIMNHRDPFDFQCSVKVNRTANRKPCYLYHGDQIVQRNSRYYVSTDGHGLEKEMVKRNATEPSRTGIEAGWTVTITNDMSDFRWDNINWLWYIEKAKKLIF